MDILCETDAPSAPMIAMTARENYKALKAVLERRISARWPPQPESASFPASKDDENTLRLLGGVNGTTVVVITTPATRLSGRLHLIASAPHVESTEEILDWDAAIVAPPPRRCGKIRARLIFRGRGKPLLEHLSDADVEIE